MPLPLLLPLALSGASFLGGLFGNHSSQTTTPQLDPAFKGLQDIIMPSIINRIKNAPNYTKALTASNTADINRTYNNAEGGLANKLTSLGLARSPGIAASGVGNLEGSRVGDIVRMKQQMPLVQHDLESSDLAQALSFLSQGRGQQTAMTSGGGLGGGVSGLATMLGYLYGNGSFGGGNGGRVGPDVLQYLGAGY